MLSHLLIPVLRERFPDRGMIAGSPPDPCAVFPGIHPGIRSVSIHDDGDELTIEVDDLTHGHFDDYTDELPEPEREQRIVERAVEFLAALFADKVVVWGTDGMGGWYRRDGGDGFRNTVIAIGGTGSKALVQEFVWSGPYTASPAEPNTAAEGGDE